MSPSTTVTHIYNTSRPADSTTSLGKRVRQCRAWTQHRGASTEKSTVCLATKPKKYPLDQRGGHTETNCCSPLATALQPALSVGSLCSAQQPAGQRGPAVRNSVARVQRGPRQAGTQQGRKGRAGRAGTASRASKGRTGEGGQGLGPAAAPGAGLGGGLRHPINGAQ